MNTAPSHHQHHTPPSTTASHRIVSYQQGQCYLTTKPVHGHELPHRLGVRLRHLLHLARVLRSQLLPVPPVLRLELLDLIAVRRCQLIECLLRLLTCGAMARSDTSRLPLPLSSRLGGWVVEGPMPPPCGLRDVQHATRFCPPRCALLCSALLPAPCSRALYHSTTPRSALPALLCLRSALLLYHTALCSASPLQLLLAAPPQETAYRVPQGPPRASRRAAP